MTGRLVLLCSALTALALLAGCATTTPLTSIQVTPGTATVPGQGNTAQFSAVGTYSNAKKDTQYTQNLTSTVTWSSSVPSVATVSSTGLATGVAGGTTTISATDGSIIGTATLTVGGTSGGGSGNTLTSITVIPGNQIVQDAGETAQYIAIGNYSGTPPTQDLTNQVTWSSSDVRVATINGAGLATAIGSCPGPGETTITALAPPSSGGAASGTATLTVGSCGVNNLPTLTVYKVGQGSGTVTSMPAGIDCGSGAGCTANFTLNTQVSLTAVADAGSVFVGWSSNCMPDNQPTCSLTMPNNETVGAIFNLAQ